MRLFIAIPVAMMAIPKKNLVTIGPWLFRARLDLVVFNDDHLYIIDYKSRSIPASLTLRDPAKSVQVLFYLCAYVYADLPLPLDVSIGYYSLYCA